MTEQDQLEMEMNEMLQKDFFNNDMFQGMPHQHPQTFITFEAHHQSFPKQVEEENEEDDDEEDKEDKEDDEDEDDEEDRHRPHHGQQHQGRH
jgi:hypothetical protein